MFATEGMKTIDMELRSSWVVTQDLEGTRPHVQIGQGRDSSALFSVLERRCRHSARLVDFAERPEDEGEQNFCSDQLILAETKRELPILDALEDGQRALVMRAGADEVALDPARHAVDALGDAGLR